MLGGWHDWAKSQNDLSRAQKSMCWGPVEADPVDGFDRAAVAGISFTRAGHGRSSAGANPARTCTVMVRAGQGRLAVGQVRLFFKWLPPWSSSEQDVVEIADVQWYEGKGVNGDLCSAPQVTKEFWDDASGNLCLVEEIIPMHVCLVPHLQRADWWQVLFLGDVV